MRCFYSIRFGLDDDSLSLSVQYRAVEVVCCCRSVVMKYIQHLASHCPINYAAAACVLYFRLVFQIIKSLAGNRSR